MSFFSGQCLVSMPGATDERFDKAVVYICAHTTEGAMGLVVNRRVEDFSFPALLSQLDITVSDYAKTVPVYAGGPVEQARGFVLHSPDYTGKTTLPVGTQTSLTVTTEILRDISAGTGPKDFLVILGYAGWDAGQLEKEIKENAWLPVKATPEILFGGNAEEKWSAAIKSLGIDPLQLASVQGKT